MDFVEIQVGHPRSIDDGNFSWTSNGSTSTGFDEDATLTVVEIVLLVVVLLVVLVVAIVLSVTDEVAVVKDVVSCLVVSTPALVDVDMVPVINSSVEVDVDRVVMLFVARLASKVAVVSINGDISVVAETNVSSGSSGICSRAMSRTSFTIRRTSSSVSSC